MRSSCLQDNCAEFSNQHLEVWIWNTVEGPGLESELEMKIRWPEKISRVGEKKCAKGSATPGNSELIACTKLESSEKMCKASKR